MGLFYGSNPWAEAAAGGLPNGPLILDSTGAIPSAKLSGVVTLAQYTPVSMALSSDTPPAITTAVFGQESPTMGQGVNHLRGAVILTSETAAIAGTVDLFTMKFDTALAGRLAQCYILRPTGSGGYTCVYTTGDFDASATGVVSFSPIGTAAQVMVGDVIGCFSTATTTIDCLSCRDSGGSIMNIGGTLRFGNLPVTRLVVGTIYSASTTGALTAVEFYPAMYAHIKLTPQLVNFQFGNKPNGFIQPDVTNRIPKGMTRLADAQWQSKTICANGMSIIFGGNADYLPGSTTVRNGYIYQLGQMLNATMINDGVPGSQICWDATQALSFSATQAGLTAAGFAATESYEVRALGQNADLYIFDFGINDRNYVGGSITDTAKNTICGAYNTVLTALFNENPFARVMLITPHCLYASSNSNQNIASIRAAIIAIGEKYCIPVLDWTESLNLSLAYGTNYLYESNPAGTPPVYGLHPNQFWHNMAARRLYDFVNSL